MPLLEIKINNLDEMEQFSKNVAHIFQDNPGIIHLDGDLGAGKTTFTKGFAKALGVTDMVTSPTFNIFKYYHGTTRNLAHFDLYRIKDNVYDQGFEDYWFSDDISIIEWAFYLPDEFKDSYKLKITINIMSENKRTIILEGDNKIIERLGVILNEFIY